MLLRLKRRRGGDGTEFPITVMNDTGSGIMSITQRDLQHVGNIQGYMGWIGDYNIGNADGVASRWPALMVKIQFIDLYTGARSDWIDEIAVVKPSLPGVPRLSGLAIRRAMYLATAPGNEMLAVSSNRPGLLTILP